MSTSPEDLERIFEAVDLVASYVDDCDDWVSVKKQILLNLPARLRKLFSTRDSKTKEQSLNQFEKDLIIYYKDNFGISLVLRSLSERRKARARAAGSWPHKVVVRVLPLGRVTTIPWAWKWKTRVTCLQRRGRRL